MLFSWIMPQWRAPLWIEVVIDDFLNSVTSRLNQLFHATGLEYWLLRPQGQIYTVIFATLIWYIVLEYSSRRDKHTAIPPSAQATDDNIPIIQDIHEQRTPVPRQSNNNLVNTPSTSDTPIMRRLAPPGHRPTNARLEGSPFRVACAFGDRTGT